MATKQSTFEENMDQLEKIVAELQNGDVPLEKAMTAFETGIKLSNEMNQTLTSAENKLTKMMESNGEEVDFTRDKGYEQQDTKTNNSDNDGEMPF